MMKTTNSALLVPSTPAGISVVPDVLILPVHIAAHSDSPLSAAEALAAQLEKIRGAVSATVPKANLEPRTYASWTEKLAGKGLRGHGIRHHAKGSLFIRLALSPDENFVRRVTMLESIRQALAPLDDGKAIAVGVPSWCVEDPESHRDTLLKRMEQNLHGCTELFEVHVGRMQGDTEVSVAVVGPTLAYVDLKLAAELRSDHTDKNGDAH